MIIAIAGFALASAFTYGELVLDWRAPHADHKIKLALTSSEVAEWPAFMGTNTGIGIVRTGPTHRCGAHRSVVHCARSGDLTAVVAQPAGEFCK